MSLVLLVWAHEIRLYEPGCQVDVCYQRAPAVCCESLIFDRTGFPPSSRITSSDEFLLVVRVLRVI